MKKRILEEEKLIHIINESISIGEVISKLGFNKSGSTYKLINDFIAEKKIDIRHFLGQTWSNGKILLHGRQIEDYLSNEIKIGSNRLKKYLLELNIKEYKCESCGLCKWMDRNIPLELHHIDGNKENNNLNNLQILCPNCHAFTHNYRRQKSNK